MTKLTKEQQIEICNAINTAVVMGKPVYVNDIRVTGAYPYFDNVRARRYDAPYQPEGFELVTGKTNVRSFIPVETNVEVIYEPPSRDTAAPYPDLSKSSP